MGPILVFLGCFIFAVGTVIGSFLNVCIYRIPWEKSVIWPGSRCPRCYSPIAACDNIPIVSWLALRGECRACGAPFAGRYALVELLVGLLFLGLFYVDVVLGNRGPYGYEIGLPLATMFYHAILVALLVAAGFIDRDLFIIPDSVTVTGMVLGIGLGTLVPAIRPMPSTGVTHAEGFWVGVIGLLVGGGLTEVVRRVATFVATLVASIINRRYTYSEAMGFGDVTLMAMIGAFLGWQGAVLTFFVGPFFGVGEACWKLCIKIKKLLARQKLSNLDRELPFGPYLGMGAIALVLTWHWFWPGFGKGGFATLRWLFWALLNVNVGPLD
jgi:leader peptidase (prepilin peptidase)/N-methyltransferase